MPFRYPLPRVMLEVVKARGNFDRMADRRARSDAAQLTPEQLLSSLRDNVEHPWAPPGGGPLGALSHDVIHGLDASAALGLDDHASLQRDAQCSVHEAGLASASPARPWETGTEGVGLRRGHPRW